VCNALYGLQGLSADLPPVRRIVRALAAELRAATPPPAPATATHPPTAAGPGPGPGPGTGLGAGATAGAVYLDARNVGNALYGLQNMTSKSRPVQVRRAPSRPLRRPLFRPLFRPLEVAIWVCVFVGPVVEKTSAARIPFTSLPTTFSGASGGCCGRRGRLPAPALSASRG